MTTQAKPIGIGSPVWIFDSNKRVYPERAPGRPDMAASPVWVGHWREHTIEGETDRSWITSYGRRQIKIPKRRYDVTSVAFSPDEIRQAAWIKENAWRLGQAVGSCRDFNALINIAEMIGFFAHPVKDLQDPLAIKIMESIETTHREKP